MIRKMTTGLVLGAAMLASGAASAQSWGGYNNGYGYGYGNGYGRDFREQRDVELIRSTCTGERGANLERYLNREVRDGRIDGRTGSRSHDEIDRLQSREYRECRERDWGAAHRIGSDYIRLRVWIDRESANGYSYRPRYRGW